MGDVIRSNAAGDDILKEVRTSLVKAIAKGGDIKTRAEQVIGPVVAMTDAIDAELKAASDLLSPFVAAVQAGNEEADAILDRTYDDTWNDVGRPANDRYLTLMYPGGAGYYTDGETPTQPVRMELLAKLYDRKLHPKLPGDKCVVYAARIREAAASLQADLDAAKTLTANVNPPRARRPVRAREPEARLQDRWNDRGRDPRHHPGPTADKEA